MSVNVGRSLVWWNLKAHGNKKGEKEKNQTQLCKNSWNYEKDKKYDIRL